MATVPEASEQQRLRRYSNAAVTLHWLTALLVVVQVIVGFTFDNMPRGPERMELFTWHKTIGATILVLSLIRLAYRVGIPGHTLAAPFRRAGKPRLLATVANPLPGDAVAGTALRAGHFLIRGCKAPISQIDFSPTARLTPPSGPARPRLAAKIRQRRSRSPPSQSVSFPSTQSLSSGRTVSDCRAAGR